MFTGIITDIGTVTQVSGDSEKRLVITTSYDTAGIDIGASIACNGTCLTVVEKGDDWFAVDASEHTLQHTTLGTWQPGTRVNLERALRAGDEMGGHLVTGHVDGLATVESRDANDQSVNFQLSCPAELAPFIASKGSVTLDGVSLTVTQVTGNSFGLTLIPHTLQVTIWGDRQPGDAVNLEVDVMARYVKRMMEAA